MDLVDSIEEMFQWQTPFYCIDNPEVVDIPSLDVMLVDMELPEINLVPEQADAAAAAAAAQPKPASPFHSISTTPVAAMQAPESNIRNVNNPALMVNTKLNSLQIGTREFEVPALTSPLSSAPNTPPVVKPKRSAKSKSSTLKTAKKASVELLRLGAAKEDRAPTKAEHIIRERQRRDDMAAKYSILESLLPPVPKRERAMVVEDSISFVGALQQKKVQLLKRRADLKQMAEGPGWGKKTRSLEPSGTVVHPPGSIIPSKQRSALENCKSDSTLSASSDDGVQVDPVIVTSIGPSTTSAVSAINVHLGEEEIVMEIVWSQPRSNFQSALLQAVELLGFDVTKCSILTVGNGYIQCVITCTKSQVLSQRTSEIQSSSTMIIRALRNVLTQS